MDTEEIVLSKNTSKIPLLYYSVLVAAAQIIGGFAKDSLYLHLTHVDIDVNNSRLFLHEKSSRLFIKIESGDYSNR